MHDWNAAEQKAEVTWRKCGMVYGIYQAVWTTTHKKEQLQLRWWGGREESLTLPKVIISRDICMTDRTGLLDEHAHEPVQAQWEGRECDKVTHTCQKTRNCISPSVPTVMSRKPRKQVYTLWEHNFVCAPIISEDRKKQIHKKLQILTPFPWIMAWRQTKYSTLEVTACSSAFGHITLLLPSSLCHYESRQFL